MSFTEHGHFIEQCRHGIVVAQCRCMHHDKTIHIVDCPPSCTSPQKHQKDCECGACPSDFLQGLPEAADRFAADQTRSVLERLKEEITSVPREANSRARERARIISLIEKELKQLP